MSKFSDIQNYLHFLATKHKKLKHGDNGTAFVGLHLADDNFGANKLKGLYIKIEDCSAQSKDGQIQWSVDILFLKNVSATAKRVEAITLASDETLSILQDFDARITKTFEEECFFMRSLLSSSYEPTGIMDQNAYGWRYTIRYTSYDPVFNINEWED